VGQLVYDIDSAAGANVLLVQEHHIPDELVQDKLRQLAALGWHADLTPARRTEAGGASAGVGVVRRAGLPIKAQEAAINTGHWEGRIAQAAFFRPGLTPICLMAAYLVCDQKVGPENKAILAEMGRRLERSGGPWVVGADWNLEVDDLIVDRWPEVVGGLVRAGDPSLGTCVVSTPASNIDLFVVSSDLGAIVGLANIDVSGTTWPHRSVIAQLDLSQRRVPTQLMCQPKPEWKECNASDDEAEDDTPAQVKATCAQGPIARHSGDYATALTAAVAILHNTQHSLAQGPNRSRGGDK